MILAALLLPAAQAPLPPAPTIEPRAAAKTFAEICLANAASAGRARVAAQLAGYRKSDTLPGIGYGAPLETFDKGPRGIAIREAPSGRFNCISIFAPDSAENNAAVAAAVAALPSLELEYSPGDDRRWYAVWKVRKAPKGSMVYLNIDHDIGHRSATLSLESMARK